MINPVNPIKTLAAHAKGARLGNHYHIRVNISPTTPTTPDSLKWLEPLINNLTFLDSLIKNGTKGVVLGVAAWKFQTSSEEMREYARKYFKLLDKKTNVEEEKTHLMKEIVATHKDMDFFLKLLRKSWDGPQDGKGGVTVGPLKS